MKAIKTLMLLLALGLSAYGQAVNVTANKIKGSATAPSGSCSAQQVQLTTAGVVYVCSSGTWASSGGGTTINGTDGFVPVRTNSTTFGNSAFASNALNSTYLSATSGASGAGLTLAVAGGGTNENLTFAAKGTIGDINITYGSALYLKRTVAGANSLNWLTSGGAIKGQWGLAETASTGVIGTAAGDLFFRAQGGAFWFSVDGGVTGAAVLDNNGRLIIGTGGTAVAQLSVYSQSTTRPGLKLRALSGTSSGQNVLESANASGTTTASLTAAGALTISSNLALSGQIQMLPTQFMTFGTRLYIQSQSDGAFEFGSNGGGSTTPTLKIGGVTSSFPSLKRNATDIDFRLADDSAYAAHQSLYERYGSGSPESVVTAPVGAIYHRTDGGAGTSLYVKESGSGNTGWIAK